MVNHEIMRSCPRALGPATKPHSCRCPGPDLHICKMDRCVAIVGDFDGRLCGRSCVAADDDYGQTQHEPQLHSCGQRVCVCGYREFTFTTFQHASHRNQTMAEPHNKDRLLCAHAGSREDCMRVQSVYVTRSAFVEVVLRVRVLCNVLARAVCVCVSVHNGARVRIPTRCHTDETSTRVSGEGITKGFVKRRRRHLRLSILFSGAHCPSDLPRWRKPGTCTYTMQPLRAVASPAVAR